MRDSEWLAEYGSSKNDGDLITVKNSILGKTTKERFWKRFLKTHAIKMVDFYFKVVSVEVFY